MITLADLLKIMPHAGSNAAKYLQPLNDAMREFEIDTPNREAMFLAQVAHESGELRYMEEIASGADYDRRADLGNTRPEAISAARRHKSTPGRWWKGHGPIQITGYDNHRACSIALFGDEMVLVDNPMRITTAVDGFRSAAWFWKTHGCNELADKMAFAQITKKINPGMNGWSSRLAYLANAKGVVSA